MITIVDLIDTLAKFIESIVEDYRLTTSQTGATSAKAPQVVKYFLPDKDPQNKEMVPDYPFVIVRPIDGTDDLDISILKVQLLIGVYAEDSHGIVDALNILQRLRQRLYEQEIFDKKYCLEKPCHYEIPEKQLKPEWHIVLELNFSMATLLKENIL